MNTTNCKILKGFQNIVLFGELNCYTCGQVTYTLIHWHGEQII